MTDKHQLMWSLEDYQRFLGHPDPMARDWAAKRIEHQHPQQAAESFVGLLADPDPHLQITAASAIGESSAPSYEMALLAVYPESEGFVRNWLITTLGKLRSPTLLPQLVAELEAAPSQCPPEEREMLALRSLVGALGFYPDPAARSALWDFVERYGDDDWVTYAAFAGLLSFSVPDTIPRLLRRYGQLKPRDNTAWRHAIIALADVVGVGRLTQETARMVPEDPDSVLWQLDDWLQQDIFYSEAFEDAFYAAAAESYAGILPHVLTELERVMAERGDDLSSWLEAWGAGQRLGGYRWRTLYAHQVIASLAEYPPPGQKQVQEAVALGLALLGQALVDEDDEATLQAAPDGPARRAVLLQILGSPRQNVMPDVIDQVAALGPDVVPDLIDILEGSHFWAQPRTLEALARIAREHPGTADAAIAAILDLIGEHQSDYVLEPAEKALIAIGPPAIAPAGARLGQDYVYDIYVGSALSEIPTRASAEALMRYIASKGTLEEYEAEYLAALGHPDAIYFLQDYYTPGDPLLATVLHKLALVNDYAGPERIEWWAVAVRDYADFVHISTGKLPTWVSAPDPASPGSDQERVTDEKTHEKEQPVEARAQRRRQRKKKGKKRRR